MFRDRRDAGRRLASTMLRYREDDIVVIGLPRGGVPVALEIAKALQAPLSMVFVRKIGVPWAREVAMGAVVDGAHPSVFRNGDIIRDAGISDAVFQSAMEAELDEIARRKALFSTVLPSVNLAGRTVILVDDGVATGATMKAAARAIEQNGVNRVVIAVPVAPAKAVADLQTEVEEVICLETMSSSGAVGNAYRDFRQLSDDDVIDCFREAAIAAR